MVAPSSYQRRPLSGVSGSRTPGGCNERQVAPDEVDGTMLFFGPTMGASVRDLDSDACISGGAIEISLVNFVGVGRVAGSVTAFRLESKMLRIAGGRIISMRPKKKPSANDRESLGPEDDTDSSTEKQTGSTLGRRGRSDDSDDEGSSVDNLSWAPRKKPTRTDPLVSYGRHFGRTVHAFCRPFPLIKDGLARQLQFQAGILIEEELPLQEQREHQIFNALLDLSPGLDSRILQASADELHYLADTISKGAAGPRG
ncbi:hypothetical protein NMY22_g17775 [Coprinellus aureogranulatus]|nr:hypothetical protein NMY22_g17775 [Coprinellus aureogranulatus]